SSILLSWMSVAASLMRSCRISLGKSRRASLWSWDSCLQRASDSPKAPATLRALTRSRSSLIPQSGPDACAQALAEFARVSASLASAMLSSSLAHARTDSARGCVGLCSVGDCMSDMRASARLTTLFIAGGSGQRSEEYVSLEAFG